ANAECPGREGRRDERVVLLGRGERVDPSPVVTLPADELARQGLGPGELPAVGVDLGDPQRAEGVGDRPRVVEIGRAALDFAGRPPGAGSTVGGGGGAEKGAPGPFGAARPRGWSWARPQRSSARSPSAVALP